MKKNYLFALFGIAAIAGGAYLFLAQRTTPLLRTAHRNELAGNLQQAHSLYTAALFELTPTMEIPDVNRSKILASDMLMKEVTKYLSWINAPAKPAKPDFTAALEGMERCGGQDRHDNTIAEPVITPLTPEQYLVEWNRTFFAPNVRVDPQQAALASGNYRRGISLLVIKSVKNYSYEINLLDRATGRGTRALLLAENSVRLYVQPGEHLLLCRSTVTFPSEEIWRSNFTPIPVTVPDTASLIVTELRTSVQRK